MVTIYLWIIPEAEKLGGVVINWLCFDVICEIPVNQFPDWPSLLQVFILKVMAWLDMGILMCYELSLVVEAWLWSSAGNMMGLAGGNQGGSRGACREVSEGAVNSIWDAHTLRHGVCKEYSQLLRWWCIEPSEHNMSSCHLLLSSTQHHVRQLWLWVRLKSIHLVRMLDPCSQKEPYFGTLGYFCHITDPGRNEKNNVNLMIMLYLISPQIPGGWSR